MQNANDPNHLRTHISGYLLIGIGICGMIVAVAFDFMRPHKPYFGMTQAAGFVISAIVALQGLHRVAYPRVKARTGLLLVVYLAGILFMGLRPSTHKFPDPHQFLGATYLPTRDFIINVVGFIPYGYLIVAYLFSGIRSKDNRLTKVVLAMIAGIGTSFLLETVQYFIPGRTSSLYDLIANTAGAGLGVAYCLLDRKLVS